MSSRTSGGPEATNKVPDRVIDPKQTEERLTAAFEQIAKSLERLATLSENRYQQEFPTKRVPQDVTVSRVPTEEDRIREDQGDSGETLEEWIGGREQKVIAEQARTR